MLQACALCAHARAKGTRYANVLAQRVRKDLQSSVPSGIAKHKYFTSYPGQEHIALAQFHKGLRDFVSKVLCITFDQSPV